MADDDSSDLSSLSSLSPPPSDDESDVQLEEKQGILKFFHKVDKSKAVPKEEPAESSPPPRKRSPSPPHEYVLADNPDIAFIVMFRARFSDCFAKTLATFGPQELENDVVDTVPSERVEHFLCALLRLLLNRKQDVKPGHYNRALEEAISSHKNQWPRDWEGKNPLSGGATFGSMTPVQRLALLRTLVLWTLSSSDEVKTFINKQYKTRHADDLNIGVSVQPWGSDSNKRRYFLVEGLDDTSFRVYRESNPAGVNRTWWSVAGTIDDLKALAEKLETKDAGPKAKALAKKITNSIPRFEATEEKRRRREYRLMRKHQFKRPEPGFSMYEGRTRGKRVKYNYEEDELEDDFYTDSTQARRSTRNTRNHTPAEPTGPVTTASGRQIRAPDRLNADTSSRGTPSVSGSVRGASQPAEDVEMMELGPTGRPRRTAAVNHGTNGWAPTSRKRKSDESESDEDEGSEPDFGDDEEEDEHVPVESEDEDEFNEEPLDEDDDDLQVMAAPPKLVVKLPIKANLDQDGKAMLVPGNGDLTTSRPATRPIHRNIVYSDDEETEAADSKDISAPPEDKPAENSISVAPSVTAPQEQENIPPHPATAAKPPPSPLRGPSASLAFRGSPEKPALSPAHQQADVPGAE